MANISIIYLYCTLLHDVRVCIRVAYMPRTSAAAAVLLCSVLLYCCCLLLLFVIVCRMAKNVLRFIPCDSSVLFLFIQTRFIFNVRLAWQYCGIYSAGFLPIIRITLPQ